jgi:hypothetical protein
MPNNTPNDTHDREQRESRTVPFDNDPNSLWALAAAGMITSVDVDERGILSPTPSPDAAPAFKRHPSPQLSPAPMMLPFQAQLQPFEHKSDDRGPGYTTPPPKRPPTSPPPLKRKHARVALGEIGNIALCREIEALENVNTSLCRENFNLKKQCRLQENVISSFCALEIVRHERRR